MKIQVDQADRYINVLKKKFDEFFPGNPFNYFFLDVFFDRQYRIEKQVFAAVGVFALVAIIIAGLVSCQLEYVCFIEYIAIKNDGTIQGYSYKGRT